MLLFQAVRRARQNASLDGAGFGVGCKLGSLEDLKMLGFATNWCPLFARGIANARRQWAFARACGTVSGWASRRKRIETFDAMATHAD